MLIRTLTALVGIPIILAVVYYGNLPLLFFVVLLIFLAMQEYLNMISKLEQKINRPLNYLLALSFPVLSYFNIVDMEFLTTTSLLVVAIIILVFQKGTYKSCVYHYFGIIYIGQMLTYILKIRLLEDGFKYLLFSFILIWLSDTSAFIVGKYAGKHQLSPLSPKKTIEGSIGSFIITIIFSVFIGYFWHIQLLKSFLLAILVNILSQLGDLVESSIKRHTDIKDSGNLLPGHGGVLDRFDSTFFAMPIVYQYLSFFR